MKIVKIFRLKIVIFTALKNRCMLHGRVFVMTFYFVRSSRHAIISSTQHISGNKRSPDCADVQADMRFVLHLCLKHEFA